MPFFATAGSKVYIGASRAMPEADLTVSDFDGESWTDIKNVESIGSFGDQADAVEGAFIGYQRKQTEKGQRDGGSLELVMGINYADAGQLALIAAEKTDGNYPIKIVFNDAPSGGTPSERYVVGPVMSCGEALDTVNNVMKLNASIAINSNVVRVAAAAGT